MEWKLFWMEDIPWTFPDTRYVLPRLWVRGRWEWRCKTKLRPKSGSRGWSQTIQGTHQNSLDTKHRCSSLHEVSHIPCLSLYADFLGYCQTEYLWTCHRRRWWSQKKTWRGWCSQHREYWRWSEIAWDHSTEWTQMLIQKISQEMASHSSVSMGKLWIGWGNGWWMEEGEIILHNLQG